TKILVGIGLVQIARAPAAFGRLVSALAADLGGKPIDRLMAGSVIVFFPIFGFLLSYLMTRLLLLRAFTLADLSAVLALPAKTARSVAARTVSVQNQKDADAFTLVAEQLQPSPGTIAPDERTLAAALTEASTTLRSRVFSLARDQRAAHWEDDDKEIMRRTIP